MKFVDRILEELKFYTEEDELLDEDLEEAAAPAPKEEKKSRFSFGKKDKEEDAPAPAAEPAPKEEKKSLFAKKNTTPTAAPAKSKSRTMTMPVAGQQVNMVVIEPVSFDDSQKIADYLRNNQPVIVNFERTDNVVTKRMTDFICGTVYALDGNMNKLNRDVIVCAPKSVDIDAGVGGFEKGDDAWNK